MSRLEGKVTSPLILSDNGLGSYMTVNTNQGQVHVLPAPSYSGLAAQVKATQGATVHLGYVGKLRGDNWAVLLDDNNAQYGMPMSYTTRDIQSKAQVLFIGGNGHFERKRFNTSGKRPYMEVQSFNRQILQVRYDREIPQSDLTSYRGFVIGIPDAKGNTFRLWMPLTAENIILAAEDSGYMHLRDYIRPGDFSFIRRGDVVGTIDELVAQHDEKPLLTEKKPRLVPVRSEPEKKPVVRPEPESSDKPENLATIVIDTGSRRVEYQLPVGSYRSLADILVVSRAPSKNQGRVVSAFKEGALHGQQYHLNGQSIPDGQPIVLDSRHYVVSQHIVAPVIPVAEEASISLSAADTSHLPKQKGKNTPKEAAAPVIPPRTERKEQVIKIRKQAGGF